jgi:cobalt-zinc-cadmium efflux system membrane fusion protein
VASPDISNAMSTYRKAKNRLDLARRQLDRSRDLLDHKAIAQKDFEQANADYNDAATDLQTALDALRIYGVSEDDLAAADRPGAAFRPELTMRAPISGTVVQKSVLPGQVIQAGATPCFVITNTATVWVQAHVYEQDLASVHVGDEAEMRNSAFPIAFHGRVSYIDRLVDPATRTTLVRIVTPNTDGALKKDLFVDVTLHDRTRRDVLTVPVAAVLYNEQNLPFVYVDAGSGRFTERLVKTGAQQGGAVEITDGLKAGERIVAEGSLFLQFANSVGQE